MVRRAGPLVVTAGAALLSGGGLWLALSRGWLGPDAGRGAEFCEAARDQLVLQPANTLSNTGFVVAGLLVAWHVSRSGDAGSLSSARGTAYAVVVVLLGPGSAAMHASQSTLGGHLDTTSMYLFASFAAASALARWQRWSARAATVTFIVVVAACELVGLWSRPVPVVMSAGNVAFGALLVLSLVVEVLLHQRDRATDPRWGAAGLVAMGTAFLIWNTAKQGTPWCVPDSWLQGHAAWHLLGAVAAYCLYRFWVGPPADLRRLD